VRGVCSLDAIAAQIQEDDFIITVDARRKEVYWARYLNGVRVGQPEVNFPVDVTGANIHADLFPDMVSLSNLSGNITEPVYLRRPDAVATADRP
jgi:hypothetical protein